MSDGARAEIANGIWLCRNCHKMVDNDALAYPAEMLFAWRGEHERHVINKLGSRTEKIRLDALEQSLDGLVGVGALAGQIAREKADFWEYRLTAELLRSNLKLPAREWNDLKKRLRVQGRTPIPDGEVLSWVQAKLTEGMDFMPPLIALYNVELPRAWGVPGEPGSVEEIVRVCGLIGEVAVGLVRWEKEVRSVWVSEIFRPLVESLQGGMGFQLDKLSAVSVVLDDGVDRAESRPGEQTVVEHMLEFELPTGWEEAVEREFERMRRAILGR